MPSLTITGHVYPPSLWIDAGPFKMQWTGYKESANFTCIVKIVKSRITVKISMDVYETHKPSEYLMCALTVSRAIVDPIAFGEATGLLVYLTHYAPPGQKRRPIVWFHERLSTLCTAYSPHEIVAMQELSLSNPQLRAAFNDLSEAITFPGNATINCARAVESIRRIMHSHEDRAKGWAFLQENLNVDKSYCSFISDLSISPRHGDLSAATDDEVLEVLVRTWTIFDRYLHYQRNGNQRLSEDVFPKL